jgi:hypothetical protein
MGHQIFALANGADTYKLRFGHRGFNHPVCELSTGRIDFTSQNHGYVVDPESVSGTELMKRTTGREPDPLRVTEAPGIGRMVKLLKGLAMMKPPLGATYVPDAISMTPPSSISSIATVRLATSSGTRINSPAHAGSAAPTTISAAAARQVNSSALPIRCPHSYVPSARVFRTPAT